MLYDLLRIKKIREESAHSELKKCQYRLEVAASDLEKAKKALVDYVEWRHKREVSLYNEVINEQIKQNTLDLLNQKIAKLREHDLKLKQSVKEAEAHLEKCKEQLAKAKERHLKAQKVVEKFKIFTEELKEQELKEQERLAEIEMEEFTNRNKRY